jgi:hypothetical protein
MTDYNIAMQRLLPEMPARFRRLPISPDGFPVPRFVEWVDGKPDFRVIDGRWMRRAVGERRCWLCGEQLGKYLAFVIGPMCAINRVNSEPPSHLECARFAARACPFLTQPHRKRNPHELPDNHTQAAGIPLARNPGATLIWVTRLYQLMPTKNGMLFSLGAPTSLEWYARGRTATREEAMGSIDSGLPALRKIAELEGPEAVAELEEQAKQAMALLPAA